MRSTSATVALVAAMSIGSVVAGPTPAHHRHAQLHKKQNVDWDSLDWNDMGIDWASAYSAGLAASSTPAPTSVASATVATPTSVAPVAPVVSAVSSAAAVIGSEASSVGSEIASLFKGLVGLANSRTSFGSASGSSGSAGDSYYGNVGVPYGSNMMKAASAHGQDYTINFINTSPEAITVNIWNKVGNDGQPLSGSALAPVVTSLTIALASGASQVVAFDENSQIGFAQAVSSIAESGAFATTWGECNFVSTGSGYDMSAIMNPEGNNYDMSISSVEAPGCTSDMTQNYWLTASEPIGNSDGSCFIAQSTATLTVKMGGTV